MAPEITTFCPAFEGLGEAAIVKLPDGHGVGVQQVPELGQHVVPVQQVVLVQHGVVLVQHGVVLVQHGVVLGQHGVAGWGWPPLAPTGTGQHGTI